MSSEKPGALGRRIDAVEVLKRPVFVKKCDVCGMPMEQRDGLLRCTGPGCTNFEAPKMYERVQS